MLLEVLGVRIRPTIASGSDVERLRALYPLWWRDGDDRPVDAELPFELGPDENHGLVVFQQRLDAVVLERLEGFAAAHAGVVEVDGLLVVLPGPSHSGKSSVVSQLVRDGAHYYSDEYAFFDVAGHLHAYPRPPLLRDATGAHRLDASAVARLDHHPEPRRPDVILFLAHGADEPTVSLRRIDASAAAMGLLRNTPATWSARPGLVQTFAAAAAYALAYEGTRGEAAVAWAAIRARIDQDAPAPRPELPAAERR